jgi:hypothetical protein
MYVDLKSVASTFMAFIFLINQLSIAVAFRDINFHKKNIQSSIKHEKDNLVKFNLKEIQLDKRFKWIKRQKEFLYCEVMYDVKNIITEDNVTFLLCKHDQKEQNKLSKLKNQLDSLSMNSGHTNNKNANVLGLKIEDILINFSYKSSTIQTFLQKLSFANPQFLIGNGHPSPETPPPVC